MAALSLLANSEQDGHKGIVPDVFAVAVFARQIVVVIGRRPGPVEELSD